MNHIVLLGDSIFDNGKYVHQDDRGEEPVLDQLRGLLPGGWDVTLVAVDGHRIADVCRQLDRAPADASPQPKSVQVRVVGFSRRKPRRRSGFLVGTVRQ